MLRKEDMVAGPYNPNRTPSFGELIIRELNKQAEVGMISPVVRSYAVDLTKRLEKQLTHIYGGSRHGLQQALAVVLRLTRNHLP